MRGEGRAGGEGGREKGVGLRGKGMVVWERQLAWSRQGEVAGGMGCGGGRGRW